MLGSHGPLHVACQLCKLMIGPFLALTRAAMNTKTAGLMNDCVQSIKNTCDSGVDGAHRSFNVLQPVCACVIWAECEPSCDNKVPALGSVCVLM